MGIPAPLNSEAANSLALAMVLSSQAPIILLDGDMRVIAISASFARAFEINPVSAAGAKLTDLGSGEWNVPQLGSLLSATANGHAAIDAYEFDLVRDGVEPRRLVLNAHKLDYSGSGDVRLMLSVSDVTDARIAEKLKDDLLREKAILLQELQHRVANSLQIIASVLMLSAKRVQSEETRIHLHDAHHRVMSVAAMQKHLAVSQLGDVRLRTYFTELCASIGASMIRDHNQLALNVIADDSVARADVSVSLGLIVTELVINALKHAFPGHRGGRITVSYAAEGDAWTLKVGDDGVGLPPHHDENSAGLGSGIVEALAKQLGATVEMTETHPGVEVAIAHA